MVSLLLGNFFFIRQPLDILRSFIIYFLWSESCTMHFDAEYSFDNVLKQAWVAIVEVGMTTWKAINSLKYIFESSLQDSIDQAFKVE